MPSLNFPRETTRCPHCSVHFNATWHRTEGGTESNPPIWWLIRHVKCPACERLIVALQKTVALLGGDETETQDILVWPRAADRKVPPEVPEDLSRDFREACIILGDSRRASAARSRRCLQALLRDAGGVKPGDLVKEIQQVLDSKVLPSNLADGLDAVRHIGNLAAHPTKNKTTGEIIDVEPGEAEWQLDVLEGLFDFYFVQPASLQQRKEALNKKLKSAGKPPLK